MNPIKKVNEKISSELAPKSAAPMQRAAVVIDQHNVVNEEGTSEKPHALSFTSWRFAPKHLLNWW